MKHISEYILEVTQLQLRLQDQIIKNHSLLVELGGSPDSLNVSASLPKAENDFFMTTVLSAQITSGIGAINASL
ncbi:MAG: hypothetical protein ACXWAT_00225 [Methylobacter sp.]